MWDFKDRRKKQADATLLMSALMGLCSPASLSYFSLPWARSRPTALTVSDEIGGPAGIRRALGVKQFFFRCAQSIVLDGKLSERLGEQKLFLSGTAELKVDSDGGRHAQIKWHGGLVSLT